MTYFVQKQWVFVKHNNNHLFCPVIQLSFVYFQWSLRLSSYRFNVLNAAFSLSEKGLALMSFQQKRWLKTKYLIRLSKKKKKERLPIQRFLARKSLVRVLTFLLLLGAAFSFHVCRENHIECRSVMKRCFHVANLRGETQRNILWWFNPRCNRTANSNGLWLDNFQEWLPDYACVVSNPWECSQGRLSSPDRQYNPQKSVSSRTRKRSLDSFELEESRGSLPGCLIK